MHTLLEVFSFKGTINPKIKVNKRTFIVTDKNPFLRTLT